MISKNFDIGEFIETVKGRSYEESIFLADREATATERYIYKECKTGTCEDARRYAAMLKDFILYIRHGLVTGSMRQLNLGGLGETF